MTIRRATLTLIASSLAWLALGAGAEASRVWVIHGHGFGHGIGMSQYGSWGLARHGRSHKSILSRYYRHTRLAHTRVGSVRVLLASGQGSISFVQANRACGRKLHSSRRYSFARAGKRVVLRTRSGHTIARCGREGGAAGKRPLKVRGLGVYRGKLIARRASGGLYAINNVGMESYVAGVIANEMPASWSEQALEVQAVASRSYGVATARGGPFDQYSDTRSQVYDGKKSETKRTNRATRATAGRVLKHGHKVAETFFFSTSGGHTENIENSFIGSSPVAYLKGVKDPYDGISPIHKWKKVYTQSEMQSRLSGLFSGRLRHIRVLRRGVSPRIVRARVVGSGGGSKATGPALRDRLGLYDTWARFRRKRVSKAEAKRLTVETKATPTVAGVRGGSVGEPPR